MAVEYTAVSGAKFFPCVEKTPSEVGLSSVDLKTDATTQGSILNLNGAERFTVFVKYVVVGTAATTGAFDIDLEFLDEGGNTVAASEPVAQSTHANPAAGTYYAIYSWNRGTQAVHGTNFAAVASTAATAITVPQRIRLSLDVVTVNNAGTSAVADVSVVWG